MSEVIELKAYVKKSYALASGLAGRQDWQQFFTTLSPELKKEGLIVDDHIPKATKRRVTPASKIALQAALEVSAQKEDINYAVFASRHGEITATVGLLASLAEKDILSPMRFSQSVHNTASGLFSIIKGAKHNITSIAAGESTFMMAMLEAMNYLKLYPNSKVLVCMFDELLPEYYQAYLSQRDQGYPSYGVSLLLSNEKDIEDSSLAIYLTLKANEKKAVQNSANLPDALEYYRWLNFNDTTFRRSAVGFDFIWRK
ncbi:beta-ketoacyl synthase chain length factor [Fangia hongkongensis]|uniref:beta-ketoacyl synthase chain length factor n=1 Tax=Fangia hongkongensis TaxID=270495 RepID=UPI0003A27F52|nr:beta-ketoacyl synthase chain length factor [Fangia hongkongensis]MBK2125523.1 beta-ketoacyl synthase chain length factor [Fangia hongkongensis]